MKKLFYIDACLRDGSNTKKIAEAVISELSKRYDIETIRLSDHNFPVVNNDILNDRNNGYVPEEYVEIARKIAAAERLVIAAPFWDMSFPSALKVFFENMSLFNVTFGSNEKECYGLCKAEKVLYITTRGMNISTGDELEQATPYIKALSISAKRHFPIRPRRTATESLPRDIRSSSVKRLPRATAKRITVLLSPTSC